MQPIKPLAIAPPTITKIFAVKKYFLVAVATLEMVLWVGWLVGWWVGMIVKKYSSFNDMMDFLETKTLKDIERH